MLERHDDSRSFWDHWEDFQRRFMIMVAVWIIGAVFLFPFSDAVLKYISRPVVRLVFLSPAEALSIRFRLAFLLSAAAVFPVWGYQIAQFLKEGLTKKEREALGAGFLCIGVMMAAGGIFTDRLLVPVSMNFLLQFASPALEPMITVEAYLSLYFGMMFFCCLLFNVPFVVIFLGARGLVSAVRLQQYRRHVYLACFVVAAVVTPPDVVTQFFMAVPLCSLYEITLWGLKVFGKGASGKGVGIFEDVA